MAKPLANVTLEALGFFGMNTERSQSSLPPAFAKIADNCIVDDRGRLAARLGCKYLTTTGGTSSSISQIHEFIADDNTKTIFSVGNNKVYTGTTTLTDVTGGATITADNWQMVQLNETVNFFQVGHEPLIWDDGVGSLQAHSAHSSYAGTAPQANCATAGYGRIFAGGTATDPHTVYWTDLLIPTAWSGGSSGSIDLQDHWPFGADRIKGLKIHNGFLVIFGEYSILLFSGADNPATMQLQDIISGIGCIARDSIVVTGDDLLFLDRNGYRSLGRTIQEKSSPIGIVSKNVTTDLIGTIESTDRIRAVYDRQNSNVLLMIPSLSFTWCFDASFPLEDGSWRTTTWSNVTLQAGYASSDGTLYLGSTNGIMQYSNDYVDNESDSYVMIFYSWYQDFDAPVNIKIPKGADITTQGGSGLTMQFLYSFDFTDSYIQRSIVLPTYTDSEFGTAEFGDAEFAGSSASINRNHINLRGSGRNISVGLEANINGDGLALLEMNVHSVLGRII